MSYHNDDDFRNSPKSEYQRSRSKINADLWFSQNEGQTKTFCPVCQVRLIVKEGGRILWCHSCGQSISIHDISREKKLVPKFGPALNNNNT